MKKDIFKEFAREAEQEFLTQQELHGILGGSSPINPPITNAIINCGIVTNRTDLCPGNVCDPFNAGGCAANTVMGGPGTCPLSN